MKAIFTKYLGLTNTRGSRVKAYDGDRNSVTIHWNDELDSDENHKSAAKALCRKMNWAGSMVMGGHKNVNVHVFCERVFDNNAVSKCNDDKFNVGNEVYR